MKKTLIALTAAAALAVGFSSAAKADSFGFGFGVDGSGHPHFGVSVHGGTPGYYDAGWDDDDSCHYVWKKGWHWNKYHTFKIYGPYKKLVCF